MSAVAAPRCGQVFEQAPVQFAANVSPDAREIVMNELARLKAMTRSLESSDARIEVTNAIFGFSNHSAGKITVGVRNPKLTEADVPAGLRAILGHYYGVAIFERNITVRSPLRVPYQNLFADFLAVLSSGDGASLANALAIPKEGPWTPERPENPEAPRPRDFSQVVPFKDYRHDTQFAHEQTYLDPSRAVLWNLYAKNLAPSDRGLFLQTFLRASEQHLEMRMERLSYGESPAAVNREFLRLFIREARLVGLHAKKQSSRLPHDQTKSGRLSREVKAEALPTRELTPDEIVSAVNTLTDAGRFVQTALPVPTGLKLKLNKFGFNGGFHEDGKVLEAPYRFGTAKASLEWRESMVVMIHEFGHLVFEHNFGSWRHWGEHVARALEVHEAQGRKIRGPLELEDFYDGFNELAADVLTVAYTRDLQSVSKLDPGARDFTETIELTGWTDREIHRRLSPVRSFVGTEPRLRALYERDPAKWMRVIFDSISAELEVLSTTDAHLIETLSVAQQNQRLIERLKAAIAELKD